MAKPRKKKISGEHRKVRHITATIRSTMESMFFMGSSKKRLLVYQTERIVRYLQGEDIRTATKVLVEDLMYTPRDWQCWFGAFFNDGKEQWTELMICTLPGHLLTDFSSNIDHVLRSLLDELDKTHYVGYGFFAAPNTTYNLQGMSDELQRCFIEEGFDGSTHKLPAITEAEMQYLIAATPKNPWVGINIKQKSPVAVLEYAQ